MGATRQPATGSASIRYTTCTRRRRFPENLGIGELLAPLVVMRSPSRSLLQLLLLHAGLCICRCYVAHTGHVLQHLEQPHIRMQPVQSRLRIHRAGSGDYLLCRRLAQLAVSAFYGEHQFMDGPLAYAQRAVIFDECEQDLSRRLRFYAEAMDRGLPHVGAVMVAEDEESGYISGFAECAHGHMT